MNNKFIGRITIIVAAILAIRWAASFFPDMRLWGFNQAGFFDYMPFLYPVLIAGTIYFYYRRDAILSSTENFPSESEYKIGGSLAYGMVGVSGLLFYVFRVKSFFLGDGLILIANPDMDIKYREFGEVVIHKWLFDVFSGATSDPVLLTYKVISIASGLLFCIGLVFFARKLTTTRFSFWIFILLIFLSANSVLFYGYVENYSITTALIAVSILSAVASLRAENKSMIPIVGFFIAVFLHTISLVYLPAFLVYAALTLGGTKLRHLILRKSGLLLSAMIVLLFIGYALARIWAPIFWRMAFLSPLGDQFTLDNYFLLSTGHIADFVNLLFFLIPVTLVVLIFKIVSRDWSLFNKSKPEYLFLGIAATMGLLAAFIIEPKLGMARDWDLMSVMLIGASIFGIYYWVDRFGMQKYFKPASFVLVILSVSIFVPWLVLNNSTDDVRHYCVNVMKLDPKHSRPALQSIGARLEKQGNISEAKKLDRYCTKTFPEIQMAQEAGQLYKRGQYFMAESKFKVVLKENPSWASIYKGLGLCQLEMNKYEEALENFRICDGLNPYNAYTYYCLGEAYILVGETALALKNWHKSIGGETTVTSSFISLGLFYFKANQPDSALYFWSQVPAEGAEPEIYYWKGLAAAKLNDKILADKNFDTYLKVGTDSSIINSINSMRQ